MFLRDVLKRWNVRPVDAAVADGGVASACPATPSLLAELATDPEDFADLARVLKVDLATIIRTVVATRPPTIAALIERLAAQTPSAAPAAAAAPDRPSLGSGERVGWGRWTRAQGDVRVHPETRVATPRPALAAP